MDLKTIFNLIREGEGPQVEFKRSFPSQARDMAKEMAALANHKGGTILVGVGDDGDLIGVSDPDEVMRRLSGVAWNNCRPPVNADIDKMSIGEDVYVVWVTVAPSTTPILVDGRFYSRTGSSSQPVEDGDALLSRVRLGDSLMLAASSASPRPTVMPPSVRVFKGRVSELERLATYLLDKRICVVVVEGISGVGKTTLAAQFASTLHEHEYRAFWLDCREDTSVDSILWNLAAFARSNGDYELAEILEDVNHPQEQRLTNSAIALARHSYALFFDDYQFVANPNVNRLIQKIEQRGGLTKVLLTSRVRPEVVSLVNPMATREERLQSGLDVDSCAQLLEECGLAVDRETAERIWRLTGEGHPKALLIFASRARNYPVSQLLSSLPVFRDELKQEWLTPLMKELPQDVREIVIDLSVFDRPLSFEAIRKLYPDSEIDSLTLALIDRFILDRVDEDLLSMHSLIREHCYSLIEDTEAKHKWAADYYLEELGFVTDPDMMTESQVESCLAAWSHLIKAGEHQRATSVVGKLRKTLINQGQYERLMYLIEHTDPPAEEDRIWFTINEARIFSLWGDKDYAEAMLQPLLQSRDGRFVREAVLVLALIYCDNDRPTEAISLLEEHRHHFMESSPLNMRRFLSRLVWAHRLIGELDKSLDWATEICKACEEQGDEIGGAIALRDMAAVFQAQGVLQPAKALCQQSCEMFARNHCFRDEAVTEMMLGSIFESLEDLPSAVDSYERSWEKFVRMGDRKNASLCRKKLKDLQARSGELVLVSDASTG